MAKKTTTTVVDDLDGAAGAKSITFGLDGVDYTIDLASKNEEKLRKALQEFIDNASRHRGNGKVSRKRTERDYNIAELREWAAKKKIDLPQRGRIPVAIVERYKSNLTR